MTGKRKVALLAGSRTPIGSFGRSLRKTRVDKLAEHAMRHAMRRAGVQPGQVSGVILGHAYQSSLTPNTARHTWVKAGWPSHVPGYTIQIQCGSGMKAVNEAMDQIFLGNGDLFVAGGAESMSTIPYLVRGELRFEGKFASKFKFGPRPHIGLIDDGMVPRELLWDTDSTFMSATAQRVADTYGITRQEMDEYSLRSQQLAAAAIASGRFDLEIDPIQTGNSFFSKDEHPRKTSLDKLAALGPVLKQRDITAGNSSGINDGACALVLASEQFVEKSGAKPLAYLIDHAVAGVDQGQMGIGPVEAIKKLLERNNLTIADIDLFEINEAFAAQYLGCEKLLGLDRSKVNVNGGAIALGHPIAMSGARVILTLAQELKLRGKKRGIASLCIGGGMGIATLIENPDVA
jgi:acetyl-CoA acetyltransferase family protein